MKSTPTTIALNQPFILTNGTKTGLFVVYDRDKEVTFEINAVNSQSVLGKYLLSLEINQRVFLLETSRDIYEGFWIAHTYEVLSETTRADHTIIYGNPRSPVGRFDGYQPKWIIENNAEQSSSQLSKLGPANLRSGEYFKFITNWPEAERNRRAIMRELRENLAVSLEDLKFRAKFFPIFGHFNPERTTARLELINLCEEIALTAKTNDSKLLELKLKDFETKIQDFESKFGKDHHSQFALKRHDLLHTVLIQQFESANFRIE